MGVHCQLDHLAGEERRRGSSVAAGVHDCCLFFCLMQNMFLSCNCCHFVIPATVACPLALTQLPFNCRS